MEGIIVNITQMIFMIFTVADDMIVESILPNVFSVFFVEKTLKRRYKLGNCAI